MIVCACQNVTLEDIVDLVKRYGNDPAVIIATTDIGKGGEECLDTSCESVDLPFPYAIKAVETVLRQK